MKPAPIDYDTVREMLRTATPDRVLRFIGKSHPADIALLFKGLESAEIRQLFDILFSSRRADKTLKELPPELLPDILALIDDEKVGRLIVRADPDDAVTFIDSLPDERRERVHELARPGASCRGARDHQLPRRHRGAVDDHRLHGAAARHHRPRRHRQDSRARRVGSFFYLYVVDDASKLVGVVPIRNFVIAPPARTLSDMMIADPIKADVFVDQEEAARIVSKYELFALPIVDEGGHLEGIITVDDVIDIIKEESTEDMYKMVGLAEEDRVFTPVSRSVKMRLPWTMLNLLTATLAASVVALFEDTLHEIIALVTFMPVVAGVGGNGATQTATVIIRAIALGELEFPSAWKAVVKQVSVNICIALAAGAMIAIAAILWKGNPYLGVVLAGAMILNLGLMAGFAGAVIPLLLKALKLDPALGSGVIVTGLTDAFGFLSFLGLATMFRQHLI